MKLPHPIFILVFALLVNINTNAYSQEPPCFPGFMGPTYQINDIQNCPPYDSNMPLDPFIGYLALDSLSKHVGFNEYHDFLARQSYNDTIRTMMRYIYQTVDYNPTNFLCFMYHNRYDCSPIDEYYYGLISKVLQESPSPILDASLLGSFLIAQIDVDSIYCYTDTNARWARTNRAVMATINQIYKGTTPIYNNNLPIIKPTIQFEYAREWFMGKFYDPDEILFELEKGKSYIVFLEYRYICRDNSQIYYEIFPIRCSKSKTACMYPIVNGNVIDTFNELGFGTSVNLNAFNDLLTNHINAIKNYTPLQGIIDDNKSEIVRLYNILVESKKNDGLFSHVQIKTYPTPTQSILNIEFIIDRKAVDLIFQVYNESGKLVYDNGFSYANQGLNRITEDFSFLTNGTYYFKINSEKNTFSGKFVIAK
ncbi:MAG: T9SS type A sorting domain-containing protein [bacterium]